MPKHIKAPRSKYKLKKLSDFWLDLSKLILASLVLKLFEPSGPVITFGTLVILMVGLIFSIWCARLGLEFAKRVEIL